MKFMKVRNWDKYQHYKKRNPPWVKLYTSTLDDYEFSYLPDTAKLLMVLLPLIAARTNNRIPADGGWLKSKLCLSETPDLAPLFAIRFVELIESIDVLATDASTTEERRDRAEQRRAEQSKDIHTDAQKELREKAKVLALGNRLP